MSLIRSRLLLPLAALLTLSAGAPGQSETPGRAGASPDVPATVRLGMRVLAVRQRLPVAPVLVVVPNASSYLAALERWRLDSTWPVLIDDGSDDARENIARFVRAYEPERILRWSAPEEIEGPIAPRVEAMVARAWGAESPDGLEARWKEIGFAPPGAVVASEGDAAWVAGAALAAGHGQPLIWTDVPRGRPSREMDAGQLAKLESDVADGLSDLPWAWKGLGDVIESVTLCLNVPTRIPAPPEEDGTLALTDRIGRHADGRRYAWCGMIFGDAPVASYRAMCALFLAPERGWVFDGYDAGYPPEFDAQAVLPLFEKMGLDVTFTASEGGTLAAWRGRCRAGIDGGWVHVNSAGHVRWFQLARKERAPASETPLLREPAVVHFIHSFSAQLIDRPDTISGRWLENGAYAYVGSVHEPYLQGFVPAQAYFSRLFSGVPLGAACRYDNAPAWKIQVVGDPLIIAGPGRPRGGAAPALEGAVSLDERMQEALRERRFAEAVGLLVMMGRDEDALRVTRAAMADAPKEAETPELARAAIFAAFRADDADLFARLYERLPEREAERDKHRSALWHILRWRIDVSEPDERLVSLLRRHIRRHSVVEDATALRGPMSRLYGREAVESMFLSLIQEVRSEKTREALRRAMSATHAE